MWLHLMVTIVNNSVSYTWKLLRVDLKPSHLTTHTNTHTHKQLERVKWSD